MTFQTAIVRYPFFGEEGKLYNSTAAMFPRDTLGGHLLRRRSHYLRA